MLNGLTALEALLTNDSNTELSYRLSLRVANLLGSEDAALREIVRRVILSVMALATSSELTQIRLEDLLDQLVFDETKRREVQRLASKFLHIGTPLQFVQ